MALAYTCRGWRGNMHAQRGNEFMLTQLFNGVTFAGSASILWGIMDPPILKIIGDTTMFLLVAGAAGVLFSVRQLFRAPSRN